MGGGVVENAKVDAGVKAGQVVDVATEKAIAMESISRCLTAFQYCVTNPNKESSHPEMTPTTFPDISVYLVDREWLDKWKRFVDYTNEHSGSGRSGEYPGPITIGNAVNEKGTLYNSIISSDGVGKVDVIPIDLYKFLVERYGGKGLYCRLVFANGYYRPLLQPLNVFVTDVIGKWVKYRLHPQSTLGELRDRAISDQLKQGGFGLLKDPPAWTRATHKVICPNEMCDKIQTILLIWLSEKENELRNLPEELIFQIIEMTYIVFYSHSPSFSEVKKTSNTTLKDAGIKDNQVMKISSEFLLSSTEEEVSSEFIAKIPLYVRDLTSPVKDTRFEACKNIRRVLSVLQAPIDTVVQAGAVPLLIGLLREDDNPQMQFEACWALCNVASGNSQDTMTLLQHGALPEFRRLLQSPDSNVVEQTVWALGNIAGDSAQSRDYLLGFGILNDLVRILTPGIKLSLERNTVWTISNLCRGKPSPPFQYVQSALQCLVRLIHSTDRQTIIDLLWAISYISDGANDRIQLVLDTGMLPLIAHKLSDPSESVQTPALRVIGNVVTGDDMQTQYAINAGVLPSLCNLLANSAKRGIRKEACWTISNITAGTTDQIMAVYQAGILPQLYHIIDYDANYDVKKEALWAIANWTSNTSDKALNVLFPESADKLMKMLQASDARIIQVALEGINNLLTWSSKFPEKFQKFKEIAQNYEDILAQLVSHPVKSIHDQALTIADLLFKEGDVSDFTGLPSKR